MLDCVYSWEKVIHFLLSTSTKKVTHHSTLTKEVRVQSDCVTKTVCFIFGASTSRRLRRRSWRVITTDRPRTVWHGKIFDGTPATYWIAAQKRDASGSLKLKIVFNYVPSMGILPACVVGWWHARTSTAIESVSQRSQPIQAGNEKKDGKLEMRRTSEKEKCYAAGGGWKPE